MRGRQRQQHRGQQQQHRGQQQQHRGQQQQHRGQQRQRGPALPAAVGALCRALPPRARPAPDTLRRARFDRPQASLDFWRLLYLLLKQIHGGRWTESDAIGTQVRFVKSALWYLGYGRPQLQRLPADGSVGSRELLLAFSWLLHSLGLLEQLLARNRVKTGDETSVCTVSMLVSFHPTPSVVRSSSHRALIDGGHATDASIGPLLSYSKALISSLCKLPTDVESWCLEGFGRCPEKPQLSGDELAPVLGRQVAVRKSISGGASPAISLYYSSAGSTAFSIACTGHSEFIKCEDELPNSQEGASEAGPEDRVDVRYLQWLNGRLRLQWCSLHAQHQEQCKLLHKIHLFTSGSHMDQNLGHFSVTETDLIRQPENYTQLLQLLESETVQLEAFLEWKQLEPVYWQWMETVLDNMAEEGNMYESQDDHVEKRRLPEVTSCCPWADRLTGQMDRLSRDLMALQEQLHQLIAQRKAAWLEKVAAKEELQKERFSATARKIQESVDLKLKGLSSLHAPKERKVHGSCRLVLRNKHPASKAGFGGSVSKEAVGAVSAAEVIRELQVREASLQRELQQLREVCCHRLGEIAEGLEGVIFISP